MSNQYESRFNFKYAHWRRSDGPDLLSIINLARFGRAIDTGDGTRRAMQLLTQTGALN